jgi:thiol-disulfide isomerase/thioredoxin
MGGRFSLLRILVVVVAAFAVLELVWLQLPPGVGWRGVGDLSLPRTAGCPSDVNARRDHGRADYDWALRTLDGRELRLADFRGQPLFINVWATWCGPCRDEMPDIQALHDSMKSDHVAFLLISEEEADEVRSYMDRNQFTFPVYVTARTPDVFESRGIPATFIVDQAGEIVFRRVGAARWDSDACRNFLRALHP